MKGQKIKKLLISACIISPLVLFGVVAVLANYTGPNRTVTTTVWERQNCQYRAYVASPSGYCYLTLYYPPSSCPSTSSVADYFNNAPTSCGSSWPGTCGSSISCTITQLNNSTEGCSSGQPGCTSHTSTTTYPPATVSGTTVCTLPGNAGWCRGTATLNLSGNEPLAPTYSLTFFEGSLGTLCNAPSCTWTFPEGNTSFNYWVHSTFGDTSTMASASMMVDSVAPTLTLSIPPPDGANGWFVSGPVTASASATDATSGVSGSPIINGGGASFTATTDGIYNLTATVSDVAGNTASSSGTIRLDTTPPGLSVEGNPTSPDGSNNWYVSPVVLTGTASDATSGVAGVQVQVDGGSWQNGSSLSEGVDGTHTIVFRTMDNAGNTATSVPMTVSIDRTAPNPDASLSPSSPDGANGWYVSPVTLTASSSDATSGLASQGVSLDGTTWTPSVTVSTDGTYHGPGAGPGQCRQHGQFNENDPPGYHSTDSQHPAAPCGRQQRLVRHASDRYSRRDRRHFRRREPFGLAGRQYLGAQPDPLGRRCLYRSGACDRQRRERDHRLADDLHRPHPAGHQHSGPDRHDRPGRLVHLQRRYFGFRDGCHVRRRLDTVFRGRGSLANNRPNAPGRSAYPFRSV